MKEINSLKFCYELISFIKTQTVIVTDYYTLFNNDGSTIMEYFLLKQKTPPTHSYQLQVFNLNILHIFRMTEFYY